MNGAIVYGEDGCLHGLAHIFGVGLSLGSYGTSIGVGDEDGNCGLGFVANRI